MLIKVGILAMVLLVGCGRDRSVEGGSDGTLFLGEAALPDMEIKVFASGSGELLGFGTSGLDGGFRLVKPQAQGPLILPSGDYCFTLEPLGPTSPPLPQGINDPKQTPLKIQRSSEAEPIILKLPSK